MDGEWYYALDGKQCGPVTGLEIRSLLRKESVKGSNLVWKEGMTDWKPLKDTPLFPGPAPPPRVTRSLKLPRAHKNTKSPRQRQKNRLVMSSGFYSMLEKKISQRSPKAAGKHSTSIREMLNPISSAKPKPSPPVQQKSIILTNIIEGNGIVTAIKESSEPELCSYLPAVCLAIESTPIWYRQHQVEAVMALEERVFSSKRIAQAMSLIFLSHSIRTPFVFESIKEKMLKPNSSIGDTMMYEFPLNKLMEKNMRKRLKKGFVIESKGKVVHPFQTDIGIKEVKVDDPQKTGLKSVIVSMIPSSNKEEKKISRILVKQGIDVRVDVAGMLAFRLFNCLWREANACYDSKLIECYGFQAIATGDSIGAMKYEENSFPLSQLHRLQPLNPTKLSNFVATGGALYTSTYLIGIRDRNTVDNVTVRDDGVMFQSDFKKAFGEYSAQDLYPITKSFREQIGSEHYGEFVETSVKAFRAIRTEENASLILKLVPMMFSAVYPQDKVQKFLRKTLMLKLDVESACKRFSSRIGAGDNVSLWKSLSQRSLV